MFLTVFQLEGCLAKNSKAKNSGKKVHRIAQIISYFGIKRIIEKAFVDPNLLNLKACWSAYTKLPHLKSENGEKFLECV